MLILFLFLFSFYLRASEPTSLELIAPIATEREDGLDKLPNQVFTDSTGVETWFVEERGFKAENIANTKNTPSVERKPATKKTINKKVTSAVKKKRVPASKLPVKKKKPGSKK